MNEDVARHEAQEIDSAVAASFLNHAERLSGFGCFDWDIRTNKVLWTDGLYHIYGLKPQEHEATLEAFMERVVPEDREQVQTAVQSALEGGGSFTSVERITHSSGEVRHLESRGEVLYGEDGQPARLIGVCRDVTSTKLLESQLRSSQKMEAVGRLAAGVAHDFNNLLTVISVNADLLLMPKAAEPALAVKYTEAIQDAANRASSLTSQLLMFSRQVLPQEQVLCLNRRLEMSEDLLKSLLGDRIEYRTELQEGLPCIRVDESHLDQALVNLTVNAREAMPDGGVFSIRTHVTEIDETTSTSGELKPGRYVALTMKDTGTGVAGEDADKVFEPFFSTKPGGTGLGLAVVYGVVKDWCGSVTVNSEPAEGTSVRILIPVEEATTEGETAEASGIRVGSERILVVEDQSQVRSATCYALRRNGYEVLEAENGEQALHITQSVSGDIDLLLTDVYMPGLTGPQLAEKVLRDYPDMKVLYITGYGDVQIRMDEAHLPKPYSINQLLDNVRSALDASR